MIYPVLGLQSPLLGWCRAVLVQVLQGARREACAVHVDRAEDLLRELMTRDGPLVITSSRPDGTVRRAVTEARRPFIVAAASPRDSVGHLIAHDVAPLDATRGVLGDLASLVELSARAEGLAVTFRDAAEDGARTVTAIARHFGVECGDSRAAAVAEACSGLLAANPAVRVPDAGERVGVEAALAGLDGALSGASVDRIVVTRHFFRADPDGRPSVDALDATGRNRLLVFGPFVALPAGDWTARCAYSFSDGIVGTPMSVDVIHFVGGMRELARTSFVVTSPGRLDVNVRFVHDEPSASIEVRLFCDRAIFDGTISFGFVEFSRNAAEPDTLAEVQSLLKAG